jgi:hypothetical protein
LWYFPRLENYFFTYGIADADVLRHSVSSASLSGGPVNWTS